MRNHRNPGAAGDFNLPYHSRPACSCGNGGAASDPMQETVL
jgi:hypothetical protein